MSKWKRKKFENKPVRVSNISSISGVGIADAKMLPVFFLDCEGRSDIEDLLKNYSSLERNYGMVESSFGVKSRFSKEKIYLNLEFKEPITCQITLRLDVFNHALGIEQLMINQGCYIQSNSKGNTIAETMKEPRILLEVFTEEFKEEWDRIFNRFLIKKFRKKKFSQKESIKLANEMRENLRKVDVRLKGKRY